MILPRKGLLKPFWAAGSGGAAILPACSAVFRTGLWRCFADRRELASSLVILSNPQQISRQCQSSPALRDGSFHTLNKQASGRCCLLKTQVADWKPVHRWNGLRALCSLELQLPGGGEHRCPTFQTTAEGLWPVTNLSTLLSAEDLLSASISVHRKRPHQLKLGCIEG